jgi:hypothetical protein
VGKSVLATAALLLFVTASLSGRATAAEPEYDSSYAGESAFLAISPGQTQQFTVFFTNTGTATWRKASPTQVNLAICLADKTTCNRLSPHAAWNDGTWLSPIAYATTTQDAVAPGQLGTFTYNIRPPSGIPHANYRFNGDLVHGPTLRLIHPEGYYQDATVG